MGTLGPTGTTADISTFANFKSWAGTGAFGINTALTNFGWTRTSDPNQINWAASPSAPPLSGNTYPISSVYPLSGQPWSPSGTVQTLASTSMVSNAFNTAFANEIVLVVGQSYTNTRTFTPGTGWTQDGGSSMNGQGIAAAQHRIFTTIQTGATATMTDSGADPYQMFALGLGTNGTAPVLVNFTSGSVTGGPQTTVSATAASLTTGNAVVVCMRWGASKVTDTAGNTYIPLPFMPGDNASNNDGAQFWYALNATGNAANVVTATLTSGSTNTFTFLAVWQISGGPFSIDFTPSGTLSQVGGFWNGTGAFTNFAYSVNCRGSWVSGTTYNLGDVVTSPATGASYVLSRAFDVTNVLVSGPFATCTATNDLTVTGGDVIRFTIVSVNYFLLNQTFTVVSANATSFVINLGGLIGSANNTNLAESAVAVIQRTSAVDPSNDAAWSPYHYEIWQSNDAMSFSVTNVARNAGGLATFTCSNRFKAGFNVVVSGLTNVPSLNGTWCVASATPTTFTVQTGGGSISSTADSGTATYTFQPIMMKLEYYGNTTNYIAAPWVRVSFGLGGTDGVGNLVGNFVGSNVAEFNWTNGPVFCDLRPNSATAAGAQTSSIWQCAASGASPTGTNTVGNAGRFGVSLFYNRNDTFAANSGSVFWIVERSYGDAGFASDDYITYIVGCFGNAGVFAANTTEVQQRSILKPNPTAAPISVSLVTNVLAVSYAPTLANYQFAIGATVYASNFVNATFLNDQFLSVTAVSLSLTSVASTTTVVDTITAAGNSMFGQTSYTGTFSPVIPVGTSVTITGFTNLGNNGTFTVVNCSATTLVVINTGGVKETVSASATYQQAVYTGTITNGASSFYAGQKITVTGFTNSVNNGTFTCMASSATTLTLANSAATAETHAATVTGNFFIASFTNANYGPTVDSGTLALSTSASIFTPIAGTGLVCLSDPRAACPYTSLSSLQVNGQAPLLPVFPILGFVGNPMSMGASVKAGDQVAHDTILAVTVYGITMHYNNLQGSTTTDPYAAFGGFNGANVNTTGGGNSYSGFQRTNGFLLRWD